RLAFLPGDEEEVAGPAPAAQHGLRHPLHEALHVRDLAEPGSTVLETISANGLSDVRRQVLIRQVPALPSRDVYGQALHHASPPAVVAEIEAHFVKRREREDGAYGNGNSLGVLGQVKPRNRGGQHAITVTRIEQGQCHSPIDAVRLTTPPPAP